MVIKYFEIKNIIQRHDFFQSFASIGRVDLVLHHYECCWLLTISAHEERVVRGGEEADQQHHHAGGGHHEGHRAADHPLASPLLRG